MKPEDWVLSDSGVTPLWGDGIRDDTAALQALANGGVRASGLGDWFRPSVFGAIDDD